LWQKKWSGHGRIADYGPERDGGGIGMGGGRGE